MRVVWGFDNPPALRNGVATVGSYDGVHRGHRILLDEVVSRAKQSGGESVVLTFEPHPRITLGTAEGLSLLSTFEEKCALMEMVGIDYLVVIPFDRAFSRLSREEFIEQYIVERLHISQLVVGYNHRFGHNNEGDYDFLSRYDSLNVVEIAQYKHDGEKVSSTAIRKALGQGDIATATALLGHTYIVMGNANVEGRVEVGEYKLLPKDGQYKALVEGVPTTIEVRNGAIEQRERFAQSVKIELL
ncbi:MAG: FAD synthetase [Alistipes sp.]|nr:FAD synthetase [Alistipes sp.]